MHRNALLAATLLVLASCAKRSMSQAVPGADAQAPTLDAGVSAKASEPSAVPTADAPTYSGSAMPRPRVAEGFDGGTFRTIACGDARCTAQKERCVRDQAGERWRCEPRDAPAGIGILTAWECDDASDCPAAHQCCDSFASIGRFTHCVPNHEKAACAAVLCAGPSGAPCPWGLVCRGDTCVPPVKGRATCDAAGRERCATKAPYCTFHGDAGACVDVDEAERIDSSSDPDAPGLYLCTRPSDCAYGLACCTSMSFGLRRGYCATACDLTNSMRLCSSTADCPAREAGSRPWTCESPIEPGPSVPPWIRACVQRGE